MNIYGSYDNSTTVLDEELILNKFKLSSQKIYEKIPCVRDIEYSFNSNSRTLDWFYQAVSYKETVVFIHGGYWQYCHKADFAFIVESLYENGHDVILVGYGLAPENSISSICDDINRALDFIQNRLYELGRESDGCILVGHSAGAHLATYCNQHRLVKKVVAISGIYDLRPIIDTKFNHALNLSDEEVDKYSVRKENIIKKTMLLYGENELEEIKNQSILLGSEKDINYIDCYEVSKVNHFDILNNIFSKANVKLFI